MLFGLNENTIVVAVDEMAVPAHLAESFEGIAALGNMQAERLYEEVINIQGAFTAKLQRGISSGNLQEACVEIFQEGALGNFVGKVKEMFKKLWAAIKALFAKFMAWIDSKVKSDKDFIAKYKKTLMSKISEVSDMEYKGHNWKLGNVPGTEVVAVAATVEKVVNEAAEEGKKVLKKTTIVGGGKNRAAVEGEKGKTITYGDAVDGVTKEKPEDEDKYVDQYNYMQDNSLIGEAKEDGSDREQLVEEGIKKVAAILGVKGNFTEAAEVVKEYKDMIYGGSLEAESMTGPKVSELIKVVEDYAKEKTAAEKAWKAYEKTFNNAVKEFERLEKEFNNNKDNAGKVNLSFSTKIAVAKAQASLANQAAGVFLTALKDRRDEARSILAKVVTYKKK